MARADSNVYVLASNLAGTGAAVTIRGGIYLFTAEGTVGGATISLQVQTVNGAWVNVSIFNNSPVSTATLPFAQTEICLPAGNVRMLVTGGAPTGLYAYLAGIG